MIELPTAFLLGLVGSLHCIGMCGPLALAVPRVGSTNRALVVSRLLYNGGRITTYMVIGGVFGLVGKSIALAGLQEWLSIIAGALLLVGLAFSRQAAAIAPMGRMVIKLRNRFGLLLRRRTYPAVAGLGLLNGLLPCGLVYAAATGAAASAGLLAGTGFMLAFGIGTLPVMLGLGLIGPRLQGVLGFKLQRLIPVSVALVGALLILRGLALGIPYISPDLAPEAGVTVKCH
ncbi:MAG TPA: sulfite exporter TauE/SafE family protein [Methylomirabilota bacterium]|nr:sulfite exporter TauE/SafE family protein [Methylomirabilota bacterium]